MNIVKRTEAKWEANFVYFERMGRKCRITSFRPRLSFH